MAKQLNVSLGFTADTSQAKTQIQGLVNELNKLSSVGAQSIGTEKLTSEIVEAKMAAKDLGVMLEQSFNVDTGKLDLNKFNSSLKKSGMSLTDYGNKIAMLGVQGDQAFLKIAQAIVETEVPLRRSSGLLKEFGTTLANTARWQISSSILHGFMGAIQSAYGYAKDLNKSLNDIRIVTSANTDQMADFAEKANKAAKALSATTTDYTKASLIYYQQGLSDEEVSDRTDVTIKMANAAGQSAEIVSEQLTAVWNNFYDGSKSLEYYADVMTALGAATASSTDEIAGGLEKFAAIGETIGLSYEYAASALATITSNTRQSEEVVGTALKTIFARIQGLKLGETLEDGLDLNKYSEALQAVGISVLDSIGELRKMDDILDDMAGKWDTLSKAQQAALAQTVAGTRQYTQLVALMKNWNNGDNDSMMANLDTAYGSSGALQEQADIYAESWEASEDRVRAAAEGIYQSLIDEDFFIGLNNMLEKTLTTVDKMIDSFGGIKGVLGLVGVLVTKIFSNQISQGINNALHNFQVFTGAAEHGMNRLQQEARDYAKSMTEGLIDSPAVQAQRNHLENTFTIQEKLKQSVRGLTEEQIKASEAVADTAKRYSKMAMEAGQAVEKVQELTQAQLKSSQDKVGKGAAKKLNDSVDIATGLAGGDLIREAKNAINIGEGMGNVTPQVDAVKKALSDYINILKDSSATEEEVAAKGLNVVKALGTLGDAATSAGEKYTGFQTKLADSTNVVLDAKDKFEDLQKNIDTLSTDKAGQSILDMVDDVSKLGLEFEELKEPIEKYKQALENGKGQDEALKALSDAFKKVKISAEAADKAIVKHATSSKKAAKAIKGKREEALKDAKAVRESAQAERNAAKLKEETAKKVANLDKELKKAQQAAKSFGTGFTTGLQAVSSFAMGINSLKSAFDTLNDPDMSTFDKFTSILMSLGMGIPSVLSGLKGLGTAFKDMKAGLGGSFNALMANVMGLNAEALAQDQANDEKKEAIILSGEQGKKTLVNFAESIKAAAGKALEAEAEEELNEEKLKGTGLSLGYIAMKKMEQMANAGGTAAKIAETGATIAAKLAQHGLNAALAPFIGLMLAAVAAILPYVAAAGALAAAVWLIVDAYNADAEAAKNAQAQVDSLTTQFEECTTAAEELKRTISSWEDGVSALEKLDHRTEEYKNKLKEVNEEAKKLIETYGLYDDYTVESGMIKFNEGVLENIQNQADEKASEVEAQLNVAKTIFNGANIKSQSTDLKRSLGWLYDAEATQYNAQMSQYSTQMGQNSTQSVTLPSYRYASNAEIQSFVDVIDGIIDKASAGLPDGEEIELDVDTIRQYLNEGVSGLPQIIRDNLSTLSDEDIQAVLDFRNSMIEATEANKYYAEQTMGISIENKYGDLYEKAATKDGKTDQGLVESMINAGTQFAFKNTKVNEKDLDTTLSEIDLSDATSNRSLDNYGYNIEDDKDLALTYAEKVLGWDRADVSYEKGTGKGSITNVKEDKSFEDLDDDFMRQALAQQAKVKEVTDAFNAELDSTMTNFNKALTSTVVDAKDGIAQIIVDAAGSEDKEIDFDKMMTEISPEDIAATNGMNSDQLMEYLGLTTENLEAMGLASGDEFLKGFGQAAANYDIQAFYDNMKNKAASSAASQAKDAGFSDEDVEDISDYAKHLMEVADESEELSDDLDENAEAAADLAVQISKMNRGIDTLADNFDDWNDILKKSSKSSAEYSKAMSGIKKALSDVLDVEEDFISADFVTNNLEDIEKAATGDAKAIDRLHQALAQQIVLDIVGVDKFEDLPTDLQTALNDMQSLIDNTHLDIGESISLDADSIDNTGFINACNEIIKNANMTAEQANAYFDALGFETTFVTQPQEQTQRVPEYVTETVDEGTHTVTLEDGTKQTFIRTRTRTYQDGYYEAEGAIDAMAMVTSTDGSTQVPQIQSITKKASGSMNNYSGSNSGGSSPGSGGSGGGGGSESSPSKPMKTTKRSDIGERYEQIDNKLDNLADTMTKVQNISDTLWGKSHINNLKQQNALIEEEISLLEKKYQEAKDYAASDLEDLKSAAADLGVSLQIDTNTGDILNIEEVYDKIHSKLSQAENTYNSFATSEEQSEYQEATLDPLNDQIELFDEYYALYKESLEMAEDLEIELQEKMIQIQENNFAIWQEELEIHIELNEDDMKLIEHLLNRMEDNFYSMAEAANLMVNNQFNNYIDTMKAYENSLADLEEKYKNNEINMADYVEGLNTLNDGLLETADSMIELDRAMTEYYADTLSAANDELSKYTDAMEHQNGVLDHYYNLLELTGQSRDYKKLGTILKGQVQMSRDSVEIAKNNMIRLKNDEEEFRQLYLQAIQSDNEEAAEFYKKQHEAALAAANEAEETYLSSVEEYVEKVKENLENTLAELANTLENALTGGLSLDQIAAQMERATSLQEEYLTTTNKIYETEKLIRTAQQEIDKTTNTVAKQKLKNFINETKELQKQGKLSQYELEVQQAEYDLLLAKIALEEAQNAKSTVRLQRDSSGNFGYVYTADSAQISDAEQKVMDAEQNLYQIGLDGINDYMNKYQQTVQEMYDELTELSEKYKDGEFESEEEYRQSVLEVQEYYFQKLKDYEDLYHISSEVDTRAYVDSQAVLFEENLFNTQSYIEAAIIYGEEALQNFRETSEEISQVTTEVLGDSLEDLENNTNKVIDKNKEMVNHVSNTLIPAIQNEVENVKIATKYWAEHRGEMMEVIDTAEELSGRINQLKIDLANLAAIADTIENFEYSVENYEVPETDLPSNYSPTGGDGPTGGDNYTGGNNYTGEDKTPSGKKVDGKKVGGGRTGGGVSTSNTQKTSSSNKFIDWLSSLDASVLMKGITGQYDTGGYTGEWGSYGKLAILHEKELVLNKMQTSKFAGLMSSMQEYLDLQIKMAQIPNIQGYILPLNKESETLQQMVHIEAVFPEVTEKSEIELALDNLINKASQYAYRNN